MSVVLYMSILVAHGLSKTLITLSLNWGNTYNTYETLTTRLQTLNKTYKTLHVLNLNPYTMVRFVELAKLK